MELFRRKALVHLRQRLWGNVLIVSPPSTGFVSLVISMLIAVIAAYLHLGEYSLGSLVLANLHHLMVLPRSILPRSVLYPLFLLNKVMPQ
jgi:hypothetical protein